LKRKSAREEGNAREAHPAARARGRARARTALDPGEVEAAVGKVLDERFAKPST
jgi:hypothetical protein